MPIKSLRPCGHSGCHQLVADRFCTTHKDDALPWHKLRQGHDYGSGWRKLRKFILRRDLICRHCKIREATECDHIIPVHRKGTDDPTNLQGLCRECHRTKTQREAAEARRA